MSKIKALCARLARYYDRHPVGAYLRTVLVILVVATVATACGSMGKMNEPYEDAPRGTTNQDRADTITFPDGFSNVATKCDHGNRVYVIFKGDAAYGSLSVVRDDPTCK